MATIATAKHIYREAMDQVHSYNSKLLLDRKLRMPYIDNQTGLAQQDCHLWVSRVQRCTPLREGQIYSYPSRRWRIRKRPDFIGASKQMAEKAKQETEESQESSQDEKMVAEETLSSRDFETPSHVAAVFDEYYEDEQFDSEYESDEEFGIRKSKRRKTNKSKKNSLALKLAEKIKAVSKEELDLMTSGDRKKPYDCQLCGKRYKNQQGLRYHYEHHNHDIDASQQTATSVLQMEAPLKLAADLPPVDHVAGAKRKKGTPASSYCDFCLGDVEENKKSGVSEELISCADCGRSGHPTCLQFNNNLTDQVKKYKWQCIECKCCCLCGTSDNDEQLLFCDECDRGYHMYCLNPPIDEPPEGSWQCQLCEVRVKGLDRSKVTVLPEHVDLPR